MGDAKRRGSFADRLAQPRGLTNPGRAKSIIVRRCLMSNVGECQVSFRVIEDLPAVFMCQKHWPWVPEPIRTELRRAASLVPRHTAANQLVWRNAALAAVRAVVSPRPAPTDPATTKSAPLRPEIG
jgi:hypothetical protein